MPRKKRRPSPPPAWAERQAHANTPEKRLAVAYDRLRSGLAWLRRGQDNAAAEIADRERAAVISEEVAGFLARFSEEIERRKAVTRGERNPAA